MIYLREIFTCLSRFVTYAVVLLDTLSAAGKKNEKRLFAFLQTRGQFGVFEATSLKTIF
jgi:hypothetical protein